VLHKFGLYPLAYVDFILYVVVQDITGLAESVKLIGCQAKIFMVLSYWVYRGSNWLAYVFPYM